MTPNLGLPYSSAIRRTNVATHPEVPVANAERVTLSRGVAFRHDVTTGLPVELRGADVLWLDPPWPRGWKEFYARLGATPPTSYRDMMVRLGAEVRATTTPTYAMVSKTAIASLRPDGQSMCRVFGADVTLAWWRDRPWWPDGMEHLDILARLAQRWHVIGDPFCGYGSSGLVFARAKKRFILSDLDPSCIGYIAMVGETW